MKPRGIDVIEESVKKRLTAEHGMFPYHFEALDGFLRSVDVRGKSVIEFGGSNLPRELLFETLGVKRWVSIDVIGDVHYAKQQQTKHYGRETVLPLRQASLADLERDSYLIYDGMAEDAPAHLEGQFDAVFSVTAFEHVLKFDAVLRRAHAMLKAGGTLFAYYGPIWSGSRGHHIWVSPSCNFNNLGPVPEFAHLLYRPAKLANFLRGKLPLDEITTLIFQMYRSERISRMFYEDYEEFAWASPFSKMSITPYFVRPVEASVQNHLELLYPGRKRFDAYGQVMVARKLA